MTDRAEQGQPELLGVLLMSLHVHDGNPMPLPRAVGPGAQQRRLSAAGLRRDDRHLLRRRAIQRSEKATPVDQPESCPGHQVSVRIVNDRAKARFLSRRAESPSLAAIATALAPALSAATCRSANGERSAQSRHDAWV